MNADYIDFKVETERLIEMDYERGPLGDIDQSVVEHAICEHCDSKNVYGVGFRRYATDGMFGQILANYLAYIVCRDCGYASQF